MKKKMTAGTLGAMMMITAVLPAYAAAPDANMTVQYSQGSTYTLSIPKTVTLSADSDSKAEKIGLSKVNAEPDKKVQVRLKSGITDNKVELARAGDPATKVVSTVLDKDKQPVADGFVVAEFTGTSDDPAPITGGTGVLNFTPITDSSGSAEVKAGTYSGTIVFEGVVADHTP